ncbi:MAG: hypothetical protein WAU89_23310 [Candidatus Acidiferrales bacterium]
MKYLRYILLLLLLIAAPAQAQVATPSATPTPMAVMWWFYLTSNRDSPWAQQTTVGPFSTQLQCETYEATITNGAHCTQCWEFDAYPPANLLESTATPTSTATP